MNGHRPAPGPTAGAEELRPRALRIEASSACQLRCKLCPTTTGAARAVLGIGWLTLDSFRQLIDENPWVEEIELSNYGEAFLNPQLRGIMEYAHRHGVALTCDNGVNLDRVDDQVLEALVTFGVRSITCSIDGASQETYGMYRMRGSFDRVIANIRRINHYKQRHQSEHPFLTWQFVVFGHNEAELDAARSMADSLQMRFYPKLSWDSRFSPVRDAAAVRHHLGMEAATREEFKSRYGTGYLDEVCMQLWHAPQINWDGRILGCCRNYWGEFGGNALTDGLVRAINSETMQYARTMLLGNAPARPGIPCSTCPVYHERSRTRGWLTDADVAAEAG